MKATRIFRAAQLFQRPAFTFSGEADDVTFLQMVENYFDKAGKHTSIRADKLNFYKKADNLVKFNLTLVRGHFLLMQTTAPSRPSQLSAVSTRHTSCQPRAEPGMPPMLTLVKLKLWPVL